MYRGASALAGLVLASLLLGSPAGALTLATSMLDVTQRGEIEAASIDLFVTGSYSEGLDGVFSLPTTGGDLMTLFEHDGGALRFVKDGTKVAVEDLVIDLETLTASGFVGWLQGGDPRFAGELDVFVLFQKRSDPTKFELALTPAFSELLNSAFEGQGGFNDRRQFGVAMLPIKSVPEPGTALLMGFGTLGLWVAGRRRGARAA